MRKLLFIFIGIAFLLRGFVGDAMAVAMMVDGLQRPAHSSTTAPVPMPNCHEMAQGNHGHEQNHGKNAPAKSHANCQLCCVAMALPDSAPFVFEQAASMAPPAFSPDFSSNDILQSFKPPIL